MKRDVDKRKTRKALRKLRRAAEAASAEDGPGLTTWEKDFVEGVSTRLEKYGSAFRDPGKGRLEEALSHRQAQVTRVISAKARKAQSEAKAAAKTGAAKDAGPAKPAARSTFQRKSSLNAKPKANAKSGWKPRSRDINDDPERAAPAARPARPALKIIPGGKTD
jgi:hypothetical protein